MSTAPEALAWHEAGHAVAAVLCGFQVHTVEIEDESSSSFLCAVIGIVGETHSTASSVTANSPRAERHRSAVVAMAGRAAREYRCPELGARWADFEAADRHQALSLLQPDGAPEVHLSAAFSEAQRLVAEHAQAIQAVAQLIIRAGVPGSVGGSEVERVVRSAAQQEDAPDEARKEDGQ
jgi:hypothetical protein